MLRLGTNPGADPFYLVNEVFNLLGGQVDGGVPQEEG